jgi:hypothetical protein
MVQSYHHSYQKWHHLVLLHFSQKWMFSSSNSTIQNFVFEDSGKQQIHFGKVEKSSYGRVV